MGRLGDSWGFRFWGQETMAPGQDPQGPAGWHLGNVLGGECLLVHHMQFLKLVFCLHHLSLHGIQMVFEAKALLLGL